MSNLKQTAEEILEMTGRVPLHPDPAVEQQILIQDIADIIEKSERVRELQFTVRDLDREIRQLERQLTDLEDKLEDLDLDD